MTVSDDHPKGLLKMSDIESSEDDVPAYDADEVADADWEAWDAALAKFNEADK